MFDLILDDVTSVTQSMIDNASTLLIILIAIVAIGKGIVMSSIGQVFVRAIAGLVILALLVFAVEGFMSEERFTWANWNAEGMEGWRELMGLNMLELVGYFIVMALGILIVFAIKSVIRR